MPMEVGFIETVSIRDVWPTENTDFTPWLQSHVDELDKVLGLGLSNARSEVGAGDFRIDLVAETDFGDVVVENQYGRSDHRHLGQLVTCLSHREVQRAIWIVEEARREHVKAVETLNARGGGRIWMVTVRAVRIGDSPAAPLFTVVAGPSEGVGGVSGAGDGPHGGGAAAFNRPPAAASADAPRAPPPPRACRAAGSIRRCRGSRPGCRSTDCRAGPTARARCWPPSGPGPRGR